MPASEKKTATTTSHLYRRCLFLRSVFVSCSRVHKYIPALGSADRDERGTETEKSRHGKKRRKRKSRNSLTKFRVIWKRRIIYRNLGDDHNQPKCLHQTTASRFVHFIHIFSFLLFVRNDAKMTHIESRRNCSRFETSWGTFILRYLPNDIMQYGMIYISQNKIELFVHKMEDICFLPLSRLLCFRPRFSRTLAQQTFWSGIELTNRRFRFTAINPFPISVR